MRNYNYDEHDEIEDLIGYHFTNSELLVQAFTRRSYSEEHGGLNNEELEFIGDSILNMMTVKAFYDNYGRYSWNDEDYDSMEDGAQGFYFDGQDEGSLSKKKAKIVSKKSLAEAIDRLGIAKYLRMGEGDIKNHMEDEPSVKEDLFEAIIGAIAVDSEWNYTRLEISVDLMLSLGYRLQTEHDDGVDYVALVQQWSQKHNGYPPTYDFMGLDNGNFRCLINFTIDERLRNFKGDGYSKQIARYECARKVFKYLHENNLLWTIEDELPDEITMDNAINVLQELAQKGYQDMPIYREAEKAVLYEDGSYRWECECLVPNKGIRTAANSTVKKDAKKYAAYLALCAEFDLYNEYED